jgi:hypothetical protein
MAAFDFGGIKMGYDESSLRVKVKISDGQWNNDRKLWILSREQVVALGLKERITSKLIE